MSPTLAPIKPVMLVADVCELLGISQPQFYAREEDLKRIGLLRPVLPPLDRKPRYHGGAFVEWLSDTAQARYLRELMKEAK